MAGFFVPEFEAKPEAGRKGRPPPYTQDTG